MKKILPTIFACFITAALFAQEDLRLNDSVIFINDKPVALYEKQLNNSIQRYNMEVYSFTDYVLIKAEIIKFIAPVDELKPFYYYELTFPPTNDTFSIYIKEEAFPLVLGKLIRDYKLISNDQLNKEGVAQLIANYPGGAALIEKIKQIEDHLNDTRYFKDQVIRDRTKPVKILANKKIMQDGVKIGTYNNPNTNLAVTNQSQQIQLLESQSEYNKNIAFGYIIYFENDRIASRYGEYYITHLSKGERGYNLYQISKTKNLVPGSVEDILLQRICYMIEDYSL